MRFEVTNGNEQKVQIRFDPAKGVFKGQGQEWFRFEDLMFRTEECVERVCKGFKPALTGV